MSDSRGNTYRSFASSRNPSSTTSLTSLSSADGEATYVSYSKTVSNCGCPTSAKEASGKKDRNSLPTLRLFSPGQRKETYVAADAPFVSILQGPCSKKTYKDGRRIN